MRRRLHDLDVGRRLDRGWVDPVAGREDGSHGQGRERCHDPAQQIVLVLVVRAESDEDERLLARERFPLAGPGDVVEARADVDDGRRQGPEEVEGAAGHHEHPSR